MRRASRMQAFSYLSAARNQGWIYEFAEVDCPPPTRWRIVTHPTRYHAYHDRHAVGEIVLTNREVYAFIEGCWAAAGIEPVSRAGGEPGDNFVGWLSRPDLRNREATDRPAAQVTTEAGDVD